MKTLTEDNPDSHVVPQLAPKPGEQIICKQQASALFGTGLHSRLTFDGVETILHAGCTTSGRVRASVVDRLSHNYRNVVVTDCMDDRATIPRDANLFDLD